MTKLESWDQEVLGIGWGKRNSGDQSKGLLGKGAGAGAQVPVGSWPELEDAGDGEAAGPEVGVGWAGQVSSRAEHMQSC